MHRVTGNSKMGRQLISRTRSYISNTSIFATQAVSPKAGWQFVELIGRNGHKTVAKIREHHGVIINRIIGTGRVYHEVDRINFLE